MLTYFNTIFTGVDESQHSIFKEHVSVQQLSPKGQNTDNVQNNSDPGN